MNFDLDIDDIDIERANSLLIRLYALPEKDYLHDYSLLASLAKKLRIKSEMDSTAKSAFMRWAARVDDDYMTLQFGPTREAATIAMLLVKRFESDEGINVPFNEILDAMTDVALWKLIQQSSVFHKVNTHELYNIVLPPSDENEDVESFQTIVKAMYRLKRVGFIEFVGTPHVSADHGDGWIDAITYRDL